MQIGLRFTPDISDISQESLSTIFNLMPRITVGSLVAYLISQHHDVFAFHFWKRKTNGKYLWLRNCLSTMASQAIDTIVFCVIALWGIFDTNVWLQILLTTYLLKWIVALLDTPFIYLAVKMSKKITLKESGLSLIEDN